MIRTLLFLALLLAAAPVADAAYNPNVTVRERAFASSVQAAIKRNDANWIAENVRYPIRVCVGAELTQIKDKKQFLKEYSSIIDARVEKNVVGDDLNFLNKNFQGVLLGGGSILIYDSGEGDPAPKRQRSLSLNVAPPEETLEGGHPLITAINNGSVDPTSRRLKCQ
ncbi:hypothetical protein [Roseiterribacter gracilis]|uniref:Uncharacterized protein n=1 Tax=Roseiterribacter gracilis TaxID=2812848 RepID=A0A8S8XA09_9PROT|nr:hypothetical protein TMPK1_06860 [Rhodospirillales bacterium TMPK1]